MIQTKPTTFGNGWNLVLELIDYPNGARDTISYIWGPDLSGTPQGAGGVGGLYWLEYNDTVYVPSYDNNGNIIAYYHGITGEVVATYQYDAFGCTIAQSGTMASFFRHRFSTKYYDEETGLYYYGYRFYSPEIGRWLNRDPIEEKGGCHNLFSMCQNDCINYYDMMGLDRYITQFDVFGSAGTGGTQIHVGVAVDQWKKVRIGKEECCWFWMWTGVKTYDFGPEKNVLNLFPTLVGLGKGKILERYGLHLKAPIRFKSSPEQDIMMEKLIQEDIKPPLVYNVLIQNCIVWAVDAIAYGLDQPDEDSCFVPRIIKNE